MLTKQQADSAIRLLRSTLLAGRRIDVPAIFVAAGLAEVNDQREALTIFRGLICMQKGEAGEAYSFLEAALLTCPSSEWLSHSYAEAACMSGHWRECTAMIGDAMRSQHIPALFFQQMVILLICYHQEESLLRFLHEVENACFHLPVFRSTQLALKGLAMEGRDESAAESCYREAMKTCPGYGIPFSYWLSRRLRCMGAVASVPRNVSGRRRIVFRSLGTEGRLGDTLIQYVSLQLLAEEIGRELAINRNWFGSLLLRNVDEPTYEGSTYALPYIDKNVLRLLRSGANLPMDLVASAEFLRDYFQECVDSSRIEDHAASLEKALSLSPVVRSLFDSVEAALRARGRTLVVMHVRRGDFVSTCPERVTETECYTDWLGEYWGTLDSPVLYLASDDVPSVLPAFAGYPVICLADLGLDQEGFAPDMLQDYAALACADVVLASHSAFSSTASLFNKRKPQYWGSLGGRRPLEPIPPVWFPKAGGCGKLES